MYVSVLCVWHLPRILVPSAETEVTDISLLKRTSDR